MGRSLKRNHHGTDRGLGRSCVASTGLLRKEKQFKKQFNDGDEESSTSSVEANQGDWDGDVAAWRGCDCGVIHPRPTVVFWIRCDGACLAWYNVAVDCVGFDEDDAKRMIYWFCRECGSKLATPLRLLLDLPEELLYNILQFAANPMERATVMCRQVGLLCKAAWHAVRDDPWSGVWSLLLNRDYAGAMFPVPQARSRGARAQKPSKRQRRSMRAKAEVCEAHLRLCDRTDDAHMALVRAADSDRKPLTLRRLRHILAEYGGEGSSLLINRRSASGRTFVVECCAADYVDEGVVLRCVQELVGKHGADPNVVTNEEPYANRTAIFFAISRVMPSVVEYLIRSGASLRAEMTGRFRLVSDPSTCLHGKHTPLGFARALKAAESSASGGHLPPYYMTKLNMCIKIISKAESTLRL